MLLTRELIFLPRVFLPIFFTRRLKLEPEGTYDF